MCVCSGKHYIPSRIAKRQIFSSWFDAGGSGGVCDECVRGSLGGMLLLVRDGPKFEEVEAWGGSEGQKNSTNTDEKACLQSSAGALYLNIVIDKTKLFFKALS